MVIMIKILTCLIAIHLPRKEGSFSCHNQTQMTSCEPTEVGCIGWNCWKNRMGDWGQDVSLWSQTLLMKATFSCVCADVHH